MPLLSVLNYEQINFYLKTKKHQQKNLNIKGVLLGGHVRAVFTLVTFIFIACVIFTLYSFSEIPLNVLADAANLEISKVDSLKN